MVRVEDHVLGDGEWENQATLLTVFGHMGDSKMMEVPGARIRYVLTTEEDMAGQRWAHAGDAFDKLGLPVSLDAGNADDLAGTYLEADPIHRSVAPVIERHEVSDRQHDVPRCRLLLAHHEVDRPANHHLGELLGSGCHRIGLADRLAIAQHHNAVCDLQRLIRACG